MYMIGNKLAFRSRGSGFRQVECGGRAAGRDMCGFRPLRSDAGATVVAMFIINEILIMLAVACFVRVWVIMVAI
jgi:hypothetical protein